MRCSRNARQTRKDRRERPPLSPAAEGPAPNRGTLRTVWRWASPPCRRRRRQSMSAIGSPRNPARPNASATSRGRGHSRSAAPPARAQQEAGRRCRNRAADGSAAARCRQRRPSRRGPTSFPADAAPASAMSRLEPSHRNSRPHGFGFVGRGEISDVDAGLGSAESRRKRDKQHRRQIMARVEVAPIAHLAKNG
jgi:hypothetical protein